MKKNLMLVAVCLCMLFGLAHAQSGNPYQLPNYRVGMNGGNPGASQWMNFDLSVYPDGTVLAPFNVENDVFGQSFCGTFRLELHDLRDNALLFAAESPGGCISSKGLDGHAVHSDNAMWRLQTSPEIAQRFMAHPSVYGVKSQYQTSDLLGDLIPIFAQLGIKILISK